MTTTPPESHPRLAIAVLCAAGVVVAVMQTIIVPLIPSLPTLLKTSQTNASWALTITLLVGSVITPIAGRLGDMFGKKRMVVASMAAVSVGSAVCALAPGLFVFMIGRGLQGLGIGTIALGISLMRDIVPAERLSGSVGAMSASLGVGGSLGLPFAAAIADNLNWHALFWVSAAVALLAGVAVVVTVPDHGTPTGGRFDYPGAAGLTVLLTCILLAVSKGNEWGWGSPVTLGLFAGFVVSTIWWCRWERRRENPLVDLRLNVRRAVLLTNLASIASGFAFYAMQMIPIQILMAPTGANAAGSLGFGLSMVLASLVLMPGGLVMFVFSSVSAALTGRYGARVSLSLGSLVMGGSYTVLLVMITGPWAGNWMWLLAANILSGAGLGIAYSAMPALIMRWVPVSHTGEANGVNALMRSVGTSLATAAVGMILSASTVAVQTSGGTAVPLPSSGAYVWGVCIALTTCLLATVTALSIPARRPVDEETVV
ncbi:MAG: MFS transporter [Gordonia sp. (in: high G+C Gram-positive bacteria)]|uniref:MFS transporter n=1 Tax=Gordonia sp. (in: high G+C Gram-positive bacteria) TaxID=84139 RepID=UPI0039E6F78F